MTTKTIQNHLIWLLFALFLVANLAHSAHAKAVSAQTDRQKVEMGDIITLQIQADYDIDPTFKLDVSPLKDQFEVLNQQRSKQVRMVNTNFSSFTRWTIQLLAKQPGELIIPSFNIDGERTQPVALAVNEVQFDNGAKPYFMQAEADKTEVSVQEQVLYRLRLYLKGNLINGNVRPPDFSLALSEQLKDQAVFDKTINGERYTVYEWQHAVFPQNSGELNIPGSQFNGLLYIDGRQKSVQINANAVNIAVKPAQSSPPWLPAKHLEIKQSWQNTPEPVRVGDSLQRVVTLKVVGLQASQVPDIEDTNHPGVKVYADSDNTETITNSYGITTVKRFTQAIVPTRTGALNLPDIEIRWWNTQTQTMQTSQLKTPAIDVLPNLDNPPADDSNALQAPKKDSTTTKNVATDTFLGLSALFWAGFSLIVSLFWIGLVIWLMRAKKGGKSGSNGGSSSDSKSSASQASQANERGSPATNKHNSTQAWCQGPPQQFYAQLLKQCHLTLQLDKIEDIKDEDLKANIYQLEAALYANDAQNTATLTALQETICEQWQQLIAHQDSSPSSDSALESLYGHN